MWDCSQGCDIWYIITGILGDCAASVFRVQYGGTIFFWKVSNDLPDYTMSYLRSNLQVILCSKTYSAYTWVLLCYGVAHWTQHDMATCKLRNSLLTLWKSPIIESWILCIVLVHLLANFLSSYLSQMNPFYNITPFFNNHFNIILQSKPRCLKWSLPFRYFS